MTEFGTVGSRTHLVDALHVASSGPGFAGISVDNNAVGTALAAQDTWYQVTIFGVDDASNQCTPDHTNDHITIVRAGTYLVTASFSARSTTANEYHFQVMKNNGTAGHPSLNSERHTTTANKIGSISIAGLAGLDASDTVELWVQRIDGGAVAKTITLTHATLTVLEVGA